MVGDTGERLPQANKPLLLVFLLSGNELNVVIN